MRTAAGAIVITLLACLVAGCGGQQSAPSPEVAYVNRVNAVEKQLGQPLAAVTSAAARFAGAPSTARAGGARAGQADRATRAAEAALVTALSRIDTLRRRLAALDAPPRAGQLRTALLRLVDQQAYLTDQTAKLVVFLPRFAAALRPLAPLTLRLERVLAINQAYGVAAVQAVYARKAAALRSFSASVDGLVRTLRRLRPPRVSLPGYRAQIAALTGMSLNAGRLAGVIGSGQTSAVTGLLVAFDRAATSNQTLAVRRAQIAAVKAYNAQTARLNTLSVAAEQARARLAATVR